MVVEVIDEERVMQKKWASKKVEENAEKKRNLIENKRKNSVDGIFEERGGRRERQTAYKRDK